MEEVIESIVDAMLKTLLAVAIGFVAMGCVVTARQRESLSLREDNFDANFDRTA